MAKQKQTSSRVKTRSVAKRYKEKIYESDSTYFLKLVIYVLLGTLWLKFAEPIMVAGVPLGGIPVGLLVGLLLVRRFEEFQSDRKIWYAILLVVTIISHFVPAGIVI